MITPNKILEIKVFLYQLEKCIDRGIKLIQLRNKILSESNINEYKCLAKRVVNICQQRGVKILLNSDIELAKFLEADGVHLTSSDLFKYNCNENDNNGLIIGASCHNCNEINYANKKNIDFITISPVLKTNSHIESIPLGWDKFEELSILADPPIFALGGLCKNDLILAKNKKAYGIAGIEGFWNSTEYFN